MRKKMMMMVMIDSEIIEEKVLYVGEKHEDWGAISDPTEEALHFFY